MTASYREAVGAVRRGDRRAFDRLVQAYQDRLFSLALMMVRQRTGAEEIAQDAFVRAYTHLHQYDETARSIHGWRPSRWGCRTDVPSSMRAHEPADARWPSGGCRRTLGLDGSAGLPSGR